LSFCPENAQIEFACAGAAVGAPFPVTSPASAALPLTPAKAATQNVAASNLFRIVFPLDLSVDAVSARDDKPKQVPSRLWRCPVKVRFTS
jgi:hypothetical protein